MGKRSETTSSGPVRVGIHDVPAGAKYSWRVSQAVRENNSHHVCGSISCPMVTIDLEVDLADMPHLSADARRSRYQKRVGISQLELNHLNTGGQHALIGLIYNMQMEANETLAELTRLSRQAAEQAKLQVPRLEISAVEPAPPTIH